MKLLLAEDEKELSNAIVAILKHNNYSVDAVYDGEDALCYLQNGDYDGAILDIMMPKLDGLSVLRQIRAEGNNVPVLILTARSETDDLVEGLDCGADDYLTKPYSSKELLARIRAMLRRRSSEVSDSVLRFGNTSLDTSSFELSGPLTTLRLASKEFQMMQMLISHPGQLISSERFMEKIWGYDSETEINVVWVYISYLRKKLTAIGSDIRITAVRNSGYTVEKQ
ncbi:MAG: response regulator transcription factor [Clostridia bacterium]|nr:response regulator transcription factor [Clostridia bacterium]